MASSSKDEWEKNTLAPSIGRFPPRQDQFVTDSGLEIDALYSPENLADAGLDYRRDVGFPGSRGLPLKRGQREHRRLLDKIPSS
jgi:methylmalonyl-CoA mutase N-terminal domain/subunit